jgi:hypothetical protein
MDNGKKDSHVAIDLVTEIRALDKMATDVIENNQSGQPLADEFNKLLKDPAMLHTIGKTLGGSRGSRAPQVNVCLDASGKPESVDFAPMPRGYNGLENDDELNRKRPHALILLEHGQYVPKAYPINGIAEDLINTAGFVDETGRADDAAALQTKLNLVAKDPAILNMVARDLEAHARVDYHASSTPTIGRNASGAITFIEFGAVRNQAHVVEAVLDSNHKTYSVHVMDNPTGEED